MSGGGGSGTPTSQTITQTTIPDWLRPKVEGMLGGATQQIFNTTPTQTPVLDSSGNPVMNADGTPQMQTSYNINGVKPYQAYGGTYDAQGNLTNPQQAAEAAVAGFSPLQTQVQNAAKTMQMPGQFGTATNLATQAGNYGQLATDPNAVQQYMNPYLQASLAPQMQLLSQQQGQQQAANQAQAAQAGAFGGSRMGVQNALQNQANQLAMSNLVGQGYNTAFNTANQNMQSAAGLQNAAASNLANIGSSQLGAQQGILNLQNTVGAQQQQQQQNIINQAISNYANAQQYPLQQYNAYNALLRGYAVPGQTATQYQAAPSATSMLTGLGTAGIGAAQLMNGSKKGGKISGDGIDKLAINNALKRKAKA